MQIACHFQASPPKGRLLSLGEVRSITGLAVSTIYKGASEGWFPCARKIGPRSVRWIETEIDEWIGNCRRSSTRPLGVCKYCTSKRNSPASKAGLWGNVLAVS